MKRNRLICRQKRIRLKFGSLQQFSKVHYRIQVVQFPPEMHTLDCVRITRMVHSLNQSCRLQSLMNGLGGLRMSEERKKKQQSRPTA